jgi:hypothetical protein
MQMKTPMQELLEEVIRQRDLSTDVQNREALDSMIDAIEQDYKVYEKNVILKFGIKCQMDFIKSDGIRSVDDIWEETFKNK